MGKGCPLWKRVALAALEFGADAPVGMESKVRKKGIIPIVSEDGDLKSGRDVMEKKIHEKKDEEEIITLNLSHKVMVKGGDWTIIPLENLLSKKNKGFLDADFDNILVNEGAVASSVSD